MKKTLSLMLAASFIMAPVSNCVAGYEIVTETDSQPISLFTKTAVVVGALASYVCYKKISYWYKKSSAVSFLNNAFPEVEPEPSDAGNPKKNDVSKYGLWESPKLSTVIWRERNDQIAKLLNGDTSLVNVKKEIEAEKAKLDTAVANIKPFALFTKEENKNAPGDKKVAICLWTDAELQAYYDYYDNLITRKNTAPVVDPADALGAFGWSKDGAFNALNYVWGQTKQLYSWATKPAFDAEVARTYVARFKQQHRIDTLLAIVNGANAHGQPQAPVAGQGCVPVPVAQPAAVQPAAPAAEPAENLDVFWAENGDPQARDRLNILNGRQVNQVPAPRRQPRRRR